MESSGRCRRTDGKRWRCSKDAIPNEKYCQTHMHRGCRRGSRKLVESEPKTTPNLNLTLPAKDSSAKDPSKAQDSSAENPSKTQDSSAVKRDKVTTVKLKMMSHEQEFSPKSVLGEGSREGGCPDEARRCRRTDGKRWRCTKEVIGEGQKYCANHMYRGAKKHCQDNASNPYALVKRENHTLPFAFHSP